MRRIIGIAVWLGIVLLAGAGGHVFFGLDFWETAVIAGLALIANGLFAEWEDRQRGGFYNPKGPSE